VDINGIRFDDDLNFQDGDPRVPNAVHPHTAGAGLAIFLSFLILAMLGALSSLNTGQPQKAEQPVVQHREPARQVELATSPIQDSRAVLIEDSQSRLAPEQGHIEHEQTSQPATMNPLLRSTAIPPNMDKLRYSPYAPNVQFQFWGPDKTYVGLIEGGPFYYIFHKPNWIKILTLDGRKGYVNVSLTSDEYVNCHPFRVDKPDEVEQAASILEALNSF